MASSKRDLKRKCKKEMITSTVVEGILLLYFGLLLGAAYLNVPPEDVFFEGSKTFLDAALYLAPYFMESPFGIWPSHILGISTTALIWLVCFMYNYQQYVRKYNTMYEDAYGSGGFNDDLEEYYREYVVDPSIVGGRTKKNDEGKKVTVKRIYPEGHKLPAFNCVSDEKLKVLAYMNLAEHIRDNMGRYFFDTTSVAENYHKMLTHLSQDDCPEVSEIATEQLKFMEEYYKPEQKKEQTEQEQKAEKKERKHFFGRKQGQER